MNHRKLHFRGSSLSPALWLIGVGLAIHAGLLFWSQLKSNSVQPDNVLMAAPMTAMSGTRKAPVLRGIQVVPTQISSTRWGVILVNTRTGVMAVYRFVGSQSRIQLMASRDFRSDLKLKDFNNLPPTPAQVKAMITAEKSLTRH